MTDKRIREVAEDAAIDVTIMVRLYRHPERRVADIIESAFRKLLAESESLRMDLLLDIRRRLVGAKRPQEEDSLTVTDAKNLLYWIDRQLAEAQDEKEKPC